MPLRTDTLIAAQYFTAVAGMAAMRHVLVEPSLVRDRLDDIRAVVEHLDEFPNNLEIPVVEYDCDEGYEAWAPKYDTPNPAIEGDTPVVRAILDAAPRGRALDAACGTGRFAEYLHGLGDDVIGIDASPAMLDVARAKVPGAEFRIGTLDALPMDDGSIDVLVCGLALCHVAELQPVLHEFARVVRPGGWVVISDMHPLALHLGNTGVFPGEADGFALHFVRDLVHDCSEYVGAATKAGFDIVECHEPPIPESAITSNPAYAAVPEAVRQAFGGLPFLLVWRFVRRV
jgi:ubiquinone/menaquinone biosynthesis C-methylase UbiE